MAIFGAGREFSCLGGIIHNTTTYCSEIHIGLDHILPPQTFPDDTFMLCEEAQPGCKTQLLLTIPAPTADIIKRLPHFLMIWMQDASGTGLQAVITNYSDLDMTCSQSLNTWSSASSDVWGGVVGPFRKWAYVKEVMQ